MSEKRQKGKKIIPNLHKLPATEYYATLPKATRIIISKPKQDLLDVVAEATCRDESSVRRWFLGDATPPPAARNKIAEILKTPVEVLFPEV